MVGKRKRRWRGPEEPLESREPQVDDLFYGEPAQATEPEGGDAATEPVGEEAAGEPEGADTATETAGADTATEPAGESDPMAAAPERGVEDTGAEDIGGEDIGEEDRGAHPSPVPEEHGYAARGDHRAPDGEDATGVGASPRRVRAGTAGRWARAVALAGVAAAVVYAADSGHLGTLDLASALDRTDTMSGQASGHGDRQGGLAVVTDSTIGCVGPGLVGLDDPSVPEVDQGVQVSAGSAPLQALRDEITEADGGGVTLEAVPEGDAGQLSARGEVTTVDVSGSTWVRGTAQGPLAAGFAGSQLGYSFEEQQWGLATAACLPAQDDLWLVGGGDETGRVERLILANPTGNPVTVTAEVLGAGGPVSVVGGTGIVVPPAGRHVVLLDALAPGEERPVVHVTTTGGPVVAALGDRWLEGTVDRGTEVTTPAASPATSLVIPAVPAPRPDTADVATIRLAVPGTEAAVVQLRALTPDGPKQVEQAVTNVAPGAVTDVDVADLPTGTQGIEVTADVPVVAAAHVQRRDEADGIGELAWVPASSPSAGLQGVPLATAADDAITETLSVASLEGAVVQVVTVVDGKVETRDLQVPAASSATVALEARTQSVWVRPDEGAVSSAVVSTLEHGLGTQIAGLPLPEVSVTREVRAVSPWAP